MTDQELLDYSAEHLNYEITMLYETAARLVNDPSVHHDVIVKNALIESFTTHARNLATFLYPEESQTRRDDVTSDQYVKDAEEWKTVRGALPGNLKTAIQRVAKEVGHLTTARHPAGSPQKAWSLEPILQAFIGPLKAFVARVPEGRLDISVIQFVQAFPAPTSPTPPTSSALTEEHGVLGSSSVPTGRITHITDVSTP